MLRNIQDRLGALEVSQRRGKSLEEDNDDERERPATEGEQEEEEERP